MTRKVMQLLKGIQSQLNQTLESLYIRHRHKFIQLNFIKKKLGMIDHLDKKITNVKFCKIA